MRKFLRKKWSWLAVLGLVATLGFGMAGVVNAEDEVKGEEEDKRISISISPVTETFDLKSASTYDGVLSVTNAGKVPFRFEVYSAPYSFALNEVTNDYGPDYSSENNFTQIARWIKVKNAEGEYVTSLESEDGSHPTFAAEPGQTIEVAYKITTPENIPAGGQYATLFARTLPNEGEGSGINAVANLGLKIFGRSEEGETIQSAEIKDLRISRSLQKDVEVTEKGVAMTRKMDVQNINGYALVKNTGNLDFTAKGTLTVTSIFGGNPYYQTASNDAQVSIIPESELPVADEWEETPSFGLYKATWTVAAGDLTETTSMVVCLIPPFVIVIGIILLTIIVIWIIMAIRRRKERRSRFTI